jgi:hypothetical protein
MKEENKVWQCLAFTPITTHRLQLPPTPTPPTVNVSDTTNTQMRQPAWPYNITLGEEVKDIPGITFLLASLSLGLRPSPSLVLTETLTP